MTPARCARGVLGTLRAMALAGLAGRGCSAWKGRCAKVPSANVFTPSAGYPYSCTVCQLARRAPTTISHFVTSCSSSSVVAPRPGRRSADATSAGMSAGKRSCMPTPGHARSPDRRVCTGCAAFVWRSDRLPLRNMSISGSTKFRRVFVAAGEPLLRCVCVHGTCHLCERRP